MVGAAGEGSWWQVTACCSSTCSSLCGMYGIVYALSCSTVFNCVQLCVVYKPWAGSLAQVTSAGIVNTGGTLVHQYQCPVDEMMLEGKIMECQRAERDADVVRILFFSMLREKQKM